MESVKELDKIGDYLDAITRKQSLIKEAYALFENQLNAANTKDEIEKFNKIIPVFGSYADQHELYNKVNYRLAMLDYQSAHAESQYFMAQKKFEALDNFSDAKEMAKKCVDKIKMIKDKRQACDNYMSEMDRFYYKVQKKQEVQERLVNIEAYRNQILDIDNRKIPYFIQIVIGVVISFMLISISDIYDIAYDIADTIYDDILVTLKALGFIVFVIICIVKFFTGDEVSIFIDAIKSVIIVGIIMLIYYPIFLFLGLLDHIHIVVIIVGIIIAAYTIYLFCLILKEVVMKKKILQKREYLEKQIQKEFNCISDIVNTEYKVIYDNYYIKGANVKSISDVNTKFMEMIQ